MELFLDLLSALREPFLILIGVAIVATIALIFNEVKEKKWENATV